MKKNAVKSPSIHHRSKSKMPEGHFRKVIGNVREGQGYADKRKRKILNNYQKLKRKQWLKHSSNDSNKVKEDKAEENSSLRDKEDKITTAKLHHKEETDISTKEGIRIFHPKTDETVPKQDSVPGQQTADKDGQRRYNKKRGGKRKDQNRFTKAQEEFSRKRQEEQMRAEAARRHHAERSEALERYQRKKSERHQKMSKKTRKGQPIIKHQMEFLLDKIKAQTQ